MKNIFYTTTILAAILLSASCNKNEGTGKGEGYLTVNIGFPGQGKASIPEEELLNSTQLKIYYADFSGLVRSYGYNSAPEKIMLPAGAYRLDVIAGESTKESPEKASWEHKSYKGSAPFEVKAGTETSVNVEAGVSNVISKVNFDKGLDEIFKNGYSVKVELAEDISLLYDSSRNGKEGYFIATGLVEPELKWTFSGQLASNGAQFSKSGKISGVEGGYIYSLTLKYTVKDGDILPELHVNTDTENISDIIVFEATSNGLSDSSPYEIWAAHATVHAHVSEKDYPDPSKIKFAYCKNGSDWTEVASNRTSEGIYDAVLTGLTPDTDYSYRLMIDGEQISDAKTFHTDIAPAVPNGSFENTSDGDGYKEFYGASESPWWGSGNGSKGVPGSSDYAIICEPDKSEKVDGNQSVKLMSKWAFVKFAAGNLFSGYFGGLVGTEGGRVYMGRPFTARPSALKIWLKYSAGKVNRIGGMPSGETVTTNDYDRARVIVTVGNWNPRNFGGTKECPFQFNTTNTSTLWDFRKCTGTIAYGEQILQSASNNPHNSWKEYTIPLVYTDEVTTPSHIVISCAASMLGDYFTGCDSSILWMDKAEFVYE